MIDEKLRTKLPPWFDITKIFKNIYSKTGLILFLPAILMDIPVLNLCDDKKKK